MFRSYRSYNEALTLADLIERLTRHAAVDGVLLMGSTAGSLTPDSDYDLLVVVNEMPAPLHLIFTSVDRRLTEVYIETTACIDDLLASDQPVRSHTFEGTLAEWLRTGRIMWDRNGRLCHARHVLENEQWIVPPDDGDMYRTWFHINYNVQQTARMLGSRDPIYRMAVDVRLLYSLPDVLVGYFKLHGLPSHGEKSALRHLQAHDPEFLDLFRRCIAEANREQKFALYQQLAALALDHAGGLWPDGVTAVQFAADAEVQPQTIDVALRFWGDLIRDER